MSASTFQAHKVYDNMVVDRLIKDNTLIARIYLPDGTVDTEICKIETLHGSDGRSIETVVAGKIRYFSDFITTQKSIDELKRIVRTFESKGAGPYIANVIDDIRVRTRALCYGEYLRLADALGELSEHLSDYCKIYSENYNDDTVDDLLRPIDTRDWIFDNTRTNKLMRPSEIMAWIDVADLTEADFMEFVKMEIDEDGYEIEVDHEFVKCTLDNIHDYSKCVTDAITYMRA